jgi:hypothetical protein
VSQELLYTSAPRGLLPGARGFCTVAATRSISAKLLERLERLSSYRSVFPPDDPMADLNPVQFSHLRFSVGRDSYDVLSRICSAELDYSQRTNFFAHHVVLEGGELPPLGPAWLLEQPGYMRSSWDGTVGYLPVPESLPAGAAEAGPCCRWGELTGDAGWAGVVAETYLAKPDRQIYLVYEPGLDMLPLFAEVLTLLTPEQRWSVSFNTYFTSTGLPQGYACVLRGILAPSAEAKDAARLPGAFVLRLGKPLGRAAGGLLVEQARTGIAPPVKIRHSSGSAKRVRESVKDLPAPAEQPEEPAMFEYEDEPSNMAASDTRASPAPPEDGAGFDLSRMTLSAPPPIRARHLKHQRKPGFDRLMVAGGFAACLLFGVVCIVVVLNRRSPSAATAVVEASVKEEQSRTLEQAQPAPTPETQPAPATPQPPQGTDPQKPLVGPPSPAPKQSAAPVRPVRPSQGDGRIVSAARQQPNANMLNRIDLPEAAARGHEIPIVTAEPLDGDLSLGGNLSFTFTRGEGSPESGRLRVDPQSGSELIVSYETKSSVGDEVNKVEIASFRLESGKLLFAWLANAMTASRQICKSAEEHLRNLILHCRQGTGTKLFALRRPVSDREIPIAFDPPSKKDHTSKKDPSLPPIDKEIALKWDGTHPQPRTELFVENCRIQIGKQTIHLNAPADRDLRELVHEPAEQFGPDLSLESCKLEVLPKEGLPKTRLKLQIRLLARKQELESSKDSGKPPLAADPRGQSIQIEIQAVTVYAKVEDMRVVVYQLGMPDMRKSTGP